MHTSLSIPTPCHENWNAMTAVEKGRYCKACDKVLTDFSGMSDTELLHFLARQDSKLCGRFSASQLERALQPATSSPSRFSTFWKLLVASLLATAPAQAHERGQSALEWRSGGAVVGQHKPQQNGNGLKRLLKGTVVKAGTMTPVAGATVHLPALQIKVVTDKDGKFKIQYTAPDEVLELDITADGLEEQQILITPKEQTTVQVYMEQGSTTLGDSLDQPLLIDTLPLREEGMVVGMLVAFKEVELTERVVRRVDDWTPEWIRRKEIKVSPNPIVAGQPAQLTLKGITAGWYSLEVLDASGRIVDHRRIDLNGSMENVRLSTEEGWAKGIYWIRLSSVSHKRVYNAKLVIQ